MSVCLYVLILNPLMHKQKGTFDARAIWGGGRSSILQLIFLRENSPLIEFRTLVDWKERHKLLKVKFPLQIRSDFASYEIQYGLVRRPTHQNTPFDAAMFEVCGHRFADLSESQYGVALLNDSKYGYSCENGNVLCLSLLRAPKAPDEDCDMHAQLFRYALLPHVHSAGGSDLSEVVRAAAAFNVKLISCPCSGPTSRLTDNTAIPITDSITVPDLILDNKDNHISIKTEKNAQKYRF